MILLLQCLHVIHEEGYSTSNPYFDNLQSRSKHIPLKVVHPNLRIFQQGVYGFQLGGQQLFDEDDRGFGRVSPLPNPLYSLHPPPRLIVVFPDFMNCTFYQEVRSRS
jgi:hypothetical protein